jgi:DNA replication protein DnaC
VTTEAPPSPSASENSSASRDWSLGYDTEWPPAEPQREALRLARRRVAEWINGDILAVVLAGEPGCGKTHLASAAVSWLNDPLYALLVDEPNLNADIRATYDGDGTEKAIVGRLRRTPRLVIDDVGTAPVKETSREWWQSVLWRIIDRRYERQMPLIVTTNMDLVELARWLGARAFSRLQGMLETNENFVDMFDVPDYRAKDWKR